MKVRVIRVFRVPDCDTRITRNKFGFCKLLPEIPEQNSGFGYFGFGFGYSESGLLVFCPALALVSTLLWHNRFTDQITIREPRTSIEMSS
jgi:hypothetical protein